MTPAGARARTLITAHGGPQSAFLRSRSDIAIYGGAAGGGKTWALLAEAARHVATPGYRAVIFRRTSTQVLNSGGLWDESINLYPHLGGEPLSYRLEWGFRPDAKIAFRHLDHETDKLDYQGSQIAFMGWDELTHFTESQFFYLLSRNRSLCGVRPYVRATCNPDVDSWVAPFIAWWIDQETGLAIADRAGVVRWFYRVNDRVEWYGSRVEAKAARPDLAALTPPKSVTFIPALLQDNPTLMIRDPGYLANLMAMPLVDRERLLGGNWRIRPTAGNVFRREWFGQFINAAPVGRAVRYWDQAGSTAGDYTVGVLIVESLERYYVCDVIRGRWTEHERESVIEQTAELDRQRFGGKCELWIELEPGYQAKELAGIKVRRLARFAPRFDRVRTNKLERAKPFAAQCEAGNVALVRAPWNSAYIEELVNFPCPDHKAVGVDDQVDGSSGAFNKLVLSQHGTAGPPRSHRPK